MRLDRLRAGDDHGADGGGDAMAAHDGGGGAQVFDAAVGAGADEDAVDGDLLDGLAGSEAHVVERAVEGLAVGIRGVGVGERHGGVDAGDHAGGGAPGDGGCDLCGVEGEFAVEGCAGVGGEGAPVGDGFVPEGFVDGTDIVSHP